jgi:hypothetical protein
LVSSSQLDKILELVHWLIKLRLVNECFVLNHSNLATIVARKWPDDYVDIKNALPSWVLFFNIAGYEYLPEERVNYQIKDMVEVTQRVGLEPVRAIAGISASLLLEIVHRPSGEPYWKLRYKGACHDIFFLTTFDKLSDLIGTMCDMNEEAGYPTSDMGLYLQPMVQGTNCHCEFNLFYDPEDPVESGRVRKLAIRTIKNLMGKGAFFSRPYGEGARMIMNRDAATVATLAKIKAIFDPNHIMNPGKLCF